MRPQFIEDLLKKANLPNQNLTKTSKFINFFLTYESNKGTILDPMILRIVKEIEDSEFDLPPSDNGRYPRKNRRAAHPNRRFKQAVRVLILNMLQVKAIHTAEVHLAVPLNSNEYNLRGRYTPSDMTYDPFIEAYEGLERLGYFNLEHEGFFDPLTRSGWVTRISASETLVDDYNDTKGQTHVSFTTKNINPTDKDELIILRNKIPDKGNVKIDYEDNKTTKNFRSNLKKINKVISQHDIEFNCSKENKEEILKYMSDKHIDDTEGQFPYIDESAKRLYRIFSEGSFERGGRFYRGWWQNIPSEYRKLITINGQKTIELDYSRFHISMLYAELGIEPPEDSYNIHPKVSERISKDAVNGLLNSKDLIKQHESFDSERAQTSWKEFLNLILEKHKPLTDKNLFMSGHGLTLQFYDSILAESILLHFAKKKYRAYLYMTVL